MREKVELRFATMEYGDQCVMMDGMIQMLLFFVGN